MEKDKKRKIIKWTSKTSIGIAEIDEQHKKFIELINDFYNDFEKNKAKLDVQKTFQKLLDYAEMHFKTEEDYFEEFGYALGITHAQRHADFKKDILDFKEKFMRGGGGIVFDFLVYLSKWLQDHVEAEDKGYVKCFREHGL